MIQLAVDFDFSQLSVAERLVLIERLKESIKSDQRQIPASTETIRFAGTWSQEDVEEFNKATASFEQIDEELWK